jgi:hypothetical protein
MKTEKLALTVLCAVVCVWVAACLKEHYLSVPEFLND